MRPGLRSANMADNQVEDLQQLIENLSMMLRERNAHIADLEERQEQDLIPPAPAVPRNSTINIDEECQKGKIPDLIKNLPTFAGNSRQINHWISCADRVMQMYKRIIGTDVYDLWLMEVRNKIIGEAGDLLASSGTPLVWSKIKEQLKIIYGDKRELSTLLQKLFSLKQNRNSVTNFYTAINDCYTGISTHIQMDAPLAQKNQIIDNYPEYIIRLDKMLFSTNSPDQFVQKAAHLKIVNDNCIYPLIFGRGAECNSTHFNGATQQLIGDGTLLIQNTENHTLQSNCGPDDRNLTGNFLLMFSNCTIEFNN